MFLRLCIIAVALLATRGLACVDDADCPGSYCMNDPSKTAPYTCHHPSKNTKVGRVSVVLGQDGQYTLNDELDASAAAQATFEDGLLTTGWGILNIKSNGTYPDEQQAFAAGMAEGFLTAPHIYNTATNLYPNVFSASVRNTSQVSTKVIDFMKTKLCVQ